VHSVGRARLCEAALAAIRNEPIPPGPSAARFAERRSSPLRADLPAARARADGAARDSVLLGPFFIVDEDASVGVALRKSWRATSGTETIITK